MGKSEPSQGNSPAKRPQVMLALQGGAAHGAFTWGVLDELLRQDVVDIRGVTGSSAGAVNGAFLAYGLATGGPQKAREMLDLCWKEVGANSLFSPYAPSWIDRVMGDRNLSYNPRKAFFDYLTAHVPQAVWNPSGFNPMLSLLRKHIDFDVLQNSREPLLLVNAIDVKAGRIEVFGGSALTADSVMASACIPSAFPTSEVDGRAYWDGGFMENPSVLPLVHHVPQATDLLTIMLNPTRTEEVPTEPERIQQRMTQLMHSAALFRQLGQLAEDNARLEAGTLSPASGARPVNLHMLEKKVPREHGHGSKYNTDPAWLNELKQEGILAARQWLMEHRASLGVESTLQALGHVVPDRHAVKGLGAAPVSPRRRAGPRPS